MSEPVVLTETAHGVATLTLNRPDKLNAFVPEMHARLIDELRRAGAPGSGVRAVVLTGAGRGFCAGQDLGQRAGGAPVDLGHSLDTQFNPLVRAIRGLELPVIAAVNGVAAGAGASVALACDIVIAARSASFMLAFSKIGLVPDSGVTHTLPRLVGDARARAMALLAERIAAEQAADWGMIWKVVDDADLAAEAQALARHLATQPTRALGLIKHAFNRSPDNSLDAQLDLERDLQRFAGATDDYREGVAAFLAKRAPRFKGS